MKINLGYPRLIRFKDHKIPTCWFWGERGTCQTEPWWSDASLEHYNKTGMLLRDDIVDEYTYDRLEWSQEGNRFRVGVWSDFVDRGEQFIIPIRLCKFCQEWDDLDYLGRVLLPEDVLQVVVGGLARVLFFSFKEGAAGKEELDLVKQFAINNGLQRKNFFVASSNQDPIFAAQAEILDIELLQTPFFERNCNFLEHSKDLGVPENLDQSAKSDRDKKFLCLNRRISPVRCMVSGLFQSNPELMNDTMFSFGMEGIDEEEELTGLRVVQGGWLDRFAECTEFTKVASFFCKNYKNSVLYSADMHNDRKLKTDIQNINLDLYSNCYVNVITETYFDDSRAEKIFITEKIYKSLATGQAFVVFSRPGTLAKLHEMGYQTFDTWWSEKYDSVKDDCQRISEIMKLIKKLQKKPLEWFKEMYEESEAVRKHNLEVFKRATAEEYLKKLTW